MQDDISIRRRINAFHGIGVCYFVRGINMMENKKSSNTSSIVVLIIACLWQIPVLYGGTLNAAKNGEGATFLTDFLLSAPIYIVLFVGPQILIRFAIVKGPIKKSKAVMMSALIAGIMYVIFVLTGIFAIIPSYGYGMVVTCTLIGYMILVMGKKDALKESIECENQAIDVIEIDPLKEQEPISSIQATVEPLEDDNMEQDGKETAAAYCYKCGEKIVIKNAIYCTKCGAKIII